MTQRNIVVVMPFGGRDRTQRRRAILNFKRLEHLVRQQCKVKSVASSDPTSAVHFTVEVCKAAHDEIPERALRQICGADIVIALAIDTNPNVIYEVAYRRSVERKLILVVETPDNLPIYLRSWAYHQWREDHVVDRINRIASDDFPDLPDFDAEIPHDLRDAIDKYDVELQNGLQMALQEIESNIDATPSVTARRLASIVSDETSTFFPSSLIEVSFSRRGEFANPLSPAVVRDFDEGFMRLYGYVGKTGAEADQPMTLGKLCQRIEKFTDSCAWDKFLAEQKMLTDIVIKQYGFARATVPLKINNSHPRQEYRGTCYLPCMVGQVIDGNLDGPHKMYLLIVYIELPRPEISPDSRPEISTIQPQESYHA